MVLQEVSLDECGVIPDLSADPLIGTVLGSYELVARSTVGGTGVLYRARHWLLGWDRAVKLFPATPSADDSYAKRFVREAKLAADLRHPNIVQIHDIGLDEQHYYLVMELLSGKSLAELIDDSNRLSAERAVKLLTQVAHAIDYAHDAGVAHHDLTPTNLVVSANDHVTVVDFSVASATDGTYLTSNGEIIGTLAYLAPESILGIGEGFTADGYALGVIAYELLVGHLPFPGDDPTTVMDAHTDQPPPRPRELRPELTEAVEQVLLRQLSKDPDERYATATEFVVALRTAIEVKPTRPEPTLVRTSAPREPDPWTSLQIELQEQHRSRKDQPAPARLPRRRFVATIGALVAGVGLAAGGVAIWSSNAGRSSNAGGARAASSPRAESTRQDRPLAADVPVPKPPVMSAVAGAALATASHGTLPVPIDLGSGSTLTQGLRVDAMSYYQDASGNIVVQGLLANPGTDPVSVNSFQLAFLNEAGSVVQMAKVVTAPQFVQPTARGPWMYMAGRDLTAFSSIRVVIQASPASGSTSRTQRFDITDQSIAGPTGNDVFWTINGRATNRAQVQASSVSVLAAAFDGEGKLLRVGSAFTAISRLAPGESSLFKVTIDAPTEVARYELLVQGL
jgi:serine/threonine protein kinase